ncbi:MAG: site-specific integrase, partial [Actinomycetota bacterium]
MPRAPTSSHRPLAGSVQDALEEVARPLHAERGRSDHTVRAYVADVRSLLELADAQGVRSLEGIELTLLRSWLAEMTRAGLARATIARRAAAAR